MKMVCMLGEGAWGTAVATVLAANGYQVKLWCHDPQVMQSILTTRENKRYLPGFKLDPLIIPTTDLRQAVKDAPYIFEAIPVKYLRSVIEPIAPLISKNQTWVLLSKGIESNTLLFPSQLIAHLLGYEAFHVVLAGPSFAQEVAAQQTTAITLAGDCDEALSLQKMLANSYIRPYTTADSMGAQVGAALKNVIALGIGIADGAGLSNNTKAFLLTRGLREIVTVAMLVGGKPETIYGLAGVGDLVMSSSSTQGRNFSFGRLLGKGVTLKDLSKEYPVFPESVNTTLSVHQIIAKHKLDLPVCAGVYRVLYEERGIKQVIDELMKRPLEEEC